MLCPSLAPLLLKWDRLPEFRLPGRRYLIEPTGCRGRIKSRSLTVAAHCGKALLQRRRMRHSKGCPDTRDDHGSTLGYDLVWHSQQW